jgi:hypothetical protein
LSSTTNSKGGAGHADDVEGEPHPVDLWQLCV